VCSVPRLNRIQRLGMQPAHLLGFGQQRLNGAARVFQFQPALLELFIALAQQLFRRLKAIFRGGQLCSR